MRSDRKCSIFDLLWPDPSILEGEGEGEGEKFVFLENKNIFEEKIHRLSCITRVYLCAKLETIWIFNLCPLTQKLYCDWLGPMMAPYTSHISSSIIVALYYQLCTSRFYIDVPANTFFSVLEAPRYRALIWLHWYGATWIDLVIQELHICSYL